SVANKAEATWKLKSRCTMAISRSVGTTMNTSQSAASTEAHTSGGSERRMSVAHNIREEQPAGHREDHVEGDQHGDRLARRPEAARQHRLRRLHGADQERQGERQEEEREQRLPRARARGDGGDERGGR